MFLQRVLSKAACLVLTLIPIAISQYHRDDGNGRIFPPVSNNPDDIQFHLFPSSANTHYSQEIKFREESSLKSSSFIPNSLTIFYIHGVLNIPANHVIIEAYLKSGIPGNFISVYWDKLSTPGVNGSGIIANLEFALGYAEIIPNLPIAGNRVAEFLYWLRFEGVLSFDKVHLLGHSLGAHVAGIAGERLQELGGGERVRRITGFDPAGPLVTAPIKVEHGLDREDADFVDVFHTNSGIFGSKERNGDVDIWVNNGIVQPGCESLNIQLVAGCSHLFSWKVYIAGFNKPLIACECPVWRYVLGGCDNPCVHPIIVGPYIDETARGLYHLHTGKDP